MPYGWAGKILRVDLTQKTIKQDLTESYTADFLGGKGINVKLLWDEVGPQIKPFDSENRLIFGAGPLVGTPIPAANKGSVVSKSPQTGILGNAMLGGYWAVELKFAGYDHLVISGQSERPTYLWINNGSVEFRDATHLWGKDTIETESLIRQELRGRDIQIACIGPAGENRVVSAAITHGLGNSASRTGLGAVMGSKKLKAIAIHGSQDINIAKPLELAEMCHKIMTAPPPELAKKIRGSGPGMETGTAGLAGPRFFGNQDDTLVPEFKDYPGKKNALFQKYLIRDITCFNCPIPCKALVPVPDTDHVIAMKCENVADWLVRIKLCEPSVSIKAAYLCHAYGLDSFSTTAQIAFLMDLHEKGIITEKDTDGIRMEWRNVEAMYAMIEKIAKRQGCGELFAEGIIKAAERIGRGADKFAYHVKGIEPPMQSISVLEIAVAAATSERADVTRAATTAWRAVAARQAAGKSDIYDGIASIMEQHRKSYSDIPDMLGLCRMVAGWLPQSLGCYYKIDEMPRFLSLVTGKETDLETLGIYRERMDNLLRAFNVREGMARKNDVVPEIFFSKPSQITGTPVDRDKFNSMISDFYSVKGWNANGIPSRATLEKLGLKDVADSLAKQTG